MTFDRRQKVLSVLKKAFPEYPCFMGFDFIPELKACVQNKVPFVYTDHAYFGRGYEGGNFRVILSGIHQTSLKKYEKPRIEVKPYRVARGENILLFPPSVTISQTFDTGNWVQETIDELRKYTNRPIVIKKKADGPLWDYLQDAHAVVGYATVACVESALCGVPVLNRSDHDPCKPIAFPISEVESAKPVNLTRWLATLSYSQFHLTEIQNGFCREVLLGR